LHPDYGRVTLYQHRYRFRAGNGDFPPGCITILDIARELQGPEWELLQEGDNTVAGEIKSGSIFLMIFLVVVLCPGTGWLADSRMSLSVQVKEGQLRNTPSFVGKIVDRLSYGDRVTLIREQGNWREVSTPGGLRGWMHATALTTRTIVLKAGTSPVQTGASEGEIALAGKGFSEEIEKRYKSQNPQLDFVWVDRMERFQVSPGEVQAFIKQGELSLEAGGAR
jgi:hypothetical protein